MKHLLIFISFALLSNQNVFSQEHNIHRLNYIFDPNADARKDVNNAIAKAAKEHKLVFMIVGGDWSYWCRALGGFFAWGDVPTYMNEKYVKVYVNFSPENKNVELLNAYDCPKDQGYPIIIILDAKGNRKHAQNLDQYKVALQYYDWHALFDVIKIWADSYGKE